MDNTIIKRFKDLIRNLNKEDIISNEYVNIYHDKFIDLDYFDYVGLQILNEFKSQYKIDIKIFHISRKILEDPNNDIYDNENNYDITTLTRRMSSSSVDIGQLMDKDFDDLVDCQETQKFFCYIDADINVVKFIVFVLNQQYNLINFLLDCYLDE